MCSSVFPASSGKGRRTDADSTVFGLVEHAEVWEDMAIPSSFAKLSTSSPILLVAYGIKELVDEALLGDAIAAVVIIAHRYSNVSFEASSYQG